MSTATSKISPAKIGPLFFVSVLALVLAGELSEGFAQPQNTAPAANQQLTPFEEAVFAIKQLSKENKALRIQIAASPDPTVVQKYNETLIRQYQYQQRLMETVEATFAWQRFAANVLLGLVALVVVCGLGFSGYQLYKTIEKGGPQSDTSMELSAAKFRITSSVTGLIVLSFSLIFLFLFVQEVFEIEPINLGAVQDSADSGTKSNNTTGTQP